MGTWGCSSLGRASGTETRPGEKVNSHGGVAHLGERLNGIQEVRGSIPLISTRDRVAADEVATLFFRVKTV